MTYCISCKEEIPSDEVHTEFSLHCPIRQERTIQNEMKYECKLNLIQINRILKDDKKRERSYMKRVLKEKMGWEWKLKEQEGFLRCQTTTSNLRLKAEGCRVNSGGCRIKS